MIQNFPVMRSLSIVCSLLYKNVSTHQMYNQVLYVRKNGRSYVKIVVCTRTAEYAA